MDVSRIPIIDYYKYCLDAAYENGFDYVMCLLARTADAETFYKKLKKYWGSLHDLTGGQILFVFAGTVSLFERENFPLYNRSHCLKELSDGIVHYIDDTPFLLSVNNSYKNYHELGFDQIINSHTQSISGLKSYFGIKEKDIPALVLTPTYHSEQGNHIVVHLNDKDLYKSIKSIVEKLEEPLLKLKQARDLDDNKECNDNGFDGLGYVELSKDLRTKSETLMSLYHKAELAILQPNRDHLSDQSSNIDNNHSKRKYKIALSFPGEYRTRVAEIANELLNSFSIEEILYDEYHQAEFARPNLDTYLQDLYRNKSELIVVFISNDYERRNWCGIEWRAIRDLMNNREDDRILIIKCGNGMVEGLFETTDGYLDAVKFTNDDIIKAILSRYHLLHFSKASSVSKETGLSPKKAWVYNIILLDDVEEQLDMLKGEIERIVESDYRYAVRVFTATKTMDVVLQSQNVDIDVFVLDVARNQSLNWQLKQYDYFGYDLYKQLVNEKPNVLTKSKFFILSKLSWDSIKNEFEGANVEYMKKQLNSNADVAKRIKDYLDSLYIKETSNN